MITCNWHAFLQRFSNLKSNFLIQRWNVIYIDLSVLRAQSSQLRISSNLIPLILAWKGLFNFSRNDVRQIWEFPKCFVHILEEKYLNRKRTDVHLHSSYVLFLSPPVHSTKYVLAMQMLPFIILVIKCTSYSKFLLRNESLLGTKSLRFCSNTYYQLSFRNSQGRRSQTTPLLLSASLIQFSYIFSSNFFQHRVSNVHLSRFPASGFFRLFFLLKIEFSSATCDALQIIIHYVSSLITIGRFSLEYNPKIFNNELWHLKANWKLKTIFIL